MFLLLLLVVLIGEVSRLLGGLYLTVTRWSHCSNSCVILQGAPFLKHNHGALSGALRPLRENINAYSIQEFSSCLSDLSVRTIVAVLFVL